MDRWLRTRIDEMRTSELVTGLPRAIVVEALRRDLEAAGWRNGADPETPHRGALFERPRARIAAYELFAEEFALEDAARALAAAHGAEVSAVDRDDTLAAWRGTDELVRLYRNGTGSYRGVPWQSLYDGSAPAADLPAELLRAFRAGSYPQPIADRLADHLYGPRGPRAAEPLLEVHHAYDARWRPALEPLFAAIRAHMRTTERLRVRGLASFRRLPSEVEDLAIAVIPDRRLLDCINDGTALDVTGRDDEELDVTGLDDEELDEDLEVHDEHGHLPHARHSRNRVVDLGALLGGAASSAARALTEACAFLRTERADVLLGAGLALHARTIEGYAGVNPRTGVPIRVAPKRALAFLGW
ncbi:MAG: hypothetical protein ACTHU0_04230 [Kofleriaceae bacterium]